MSKKIMAILLALVLVLGMTTVAMAAEPIIPDAVEIKKVLTENGGLAATKTFTLEQTTATTVTYADFGVNEKAPEIDYAKVTYADNKFIITLPEYKHAGVYKYYFNEVDSKIPGMEYDGRKFGLGVYITYDADDKLVSQVKLFDVKSSTIKIDTITNTYRAGTLKVDKVVTGTGGDHTKEFEFEVTFTGGDEAAYKAITGVAVDENGVATFKLAHGANVVIGNIPVDVSYIVKETDTFGHDLTVKASDKVVDLTATGAIAYKTVEGTETIDEDTATFTNNKETIIDTGISLDNIPYILLLSVAFIGLLFFVTKRRAINE